MNTEMIKKFKKIYKDVKVDTTTKEYQAGYLDGWTDRNRQVKTTSINLSEDGKNKLINTVMNMKGFGYNEAQEIVRIISDYKDLAEHTRL